MKVKATITVPGNTSSTETLENIEESLDNHNAYNTVRILRVESVEIDDGEEEEEPVDPPVNDANIGLILGLTLPLILIILSLIFIVKTNLSGQEGNPDDDIIESNKGLDDDDKF